VRRCLRHDTQDDHGRAVLADVHVGPVERRGLQPAGSVAIQALLAVQHEAGRTDEGAIVGHQRVERVGVAPALGFGPATDHVRDRVVTHLRCPFGWIALGWISNGMGLAGTGRVVVETVHGDQWQSEIASSGQDAVQLGLVPERPGQGRLARGVA